MVVRIPMDGKSAPASIDLGAAVISGLNTNQRQTGWLWLAESGGQPQKLCFTQELSNPCTALSIPEHAAVCNAVGAVAGVVSQSITVLVNQPSFRLFRVHDPAGILDFQEPEAAIEHARRVSRELALAAALRAGAGNPQVETRIIEQRAHSPLGDDYLAEASVCSTATGRPLLGAARVN